MSSPPLPHGVTMPRTPITSFGREAELFYGTIESMARKNETSAAVVLKKLNEILTYMRAQDWESLDALELLMRKTYGIEVKADFEDPAREAMMKKLLRQATRQILAKANLLADNGRPAQAACRTEDWFEGGTLEELGGLDDDGEEKS